MRQSVATLRHTVTAHSTECVVVRIIGHKYTTPALNADTALLQQIARVSGVRGGRQHNTTQGVSPE